MKSNLLIHQISNEIAEVEKQNERLKKMLELNIIRNIEAHICLSNKITIDKYKDFIGKERFTKIHTLINNQVYNNNSNILLGFEWQGDISFWENGSPRIIEDINELKNILDSIDVSNLQSVSDK